MRSRRRNKSWLMMMAATTLHNTDSYMLTTPPSLSQPSYMTTALPSTCHYLTICHMTSPRTHVHTIHQCYTVVIRLIFQTCQLSHTVCVTHAFQWYIMFTHKQTNTFQLLHRHKLVGGQGRGFTSLYKWCCSQIASRNEDLLSCTAWPWNGSTFKHSAVIKVHYTSISG